MNIATKYTVNCVLQRTHCQIEIVYKLGTYENNLTFCIFFLLYLFFTGPTTMHLFYFQRQRSCAAKPCCQSEFRNITSYLLLNILARTYFRLLVFAYLFTESMKRVILSVGSISTPERTPDIGLRTPAPSHQPPDISHTPNNAHAYEKHVLIEVMLIELPTQKWTLLWIHICTRKNIRFKLHLTERFATS